MLLYAIAQFHRRRWALEYAVNPEAFREPYGPTIAGLVLSGILLYALIQSVIDRGKW